MNSHVHKSEFLTSALNSLSRSGLKYQISRIYVKNCDHQRRNVHFLNHPVYVTNKKKSLSPKKANRGRKIPVTSWGGYAQKFQIRTVCRLIRTSRTNKPIHKHKLYCIRVNKSKHSTAFITRILNFLWFLNDFCLFLVIRAQENCGHYYGC